MTVGKKLSISLYGQMNLFPLSDLRVMFARRHMSSGPDHGLEKVDLEKSKDKRTIISHPRKKFSSKALTKYQLQMEWSNWFGLLLLLAILGLAITAVVILKHKSGSNSCCSSACSTGCSSSSSGCSSSSDHCGCSSSSSDSCSSSSSSRRCCRS